jgi:hypothetical protein
VDRFCNEHQGKAPLIEAVPGEDEEFQVSYVWRAEEGTHRVFLFGGMQAVEAICSLLAIGLLVQVQLEPLFVLLF